MHMIEWGQAGLWVSVTHSIRQLACNQRVGFLYCAYLERHLLQGPQGRMIVSKTKICYQHGLSHLQRTQEKSQHSIVSEKGLHCHRLCGNPSSQGGLCEAKLIPRWAEGLPITPGPTVAPGNCYVLTSSFSDHFSWLMQGLLPLPTPTPRERPA